MPDLPSPDPLPLVSRYFPEITAEQLALFGRLTALVRSWNERVNLVSRKDIEHLEEHHLLHALTATRVFRPAPGARIVDVGTGGGFPGLPLAALYPGSEFTLVDSIAKKGRAVEAMAAEIGLRNVRVITARAETIRDRFDYVLGRAVAALPEFIGWTAGLLQPARRGDPANGILYFKGTLWREELEGTKLRPSAVWALHDFVPTPFFEEKFLLHFSAPIDLG